MNEDRLKFHQNTVRILLILYFFSDKYEDKNNPDRVMIFKNEVRLQKINFLIRYPSYLAYELMEIIKCHPDETETIKNIIIDIFKNDEPQLRTEEMERFLYGAWESLDKVIAFLKSFNFIKHDSRVKSNLKKYDKKYFLTIFGASRIEQGLSQIESLKWYAQRCQLIKKYFGDMTGTELRIRQYSHPEYSATALSEKIIDIEQKTKATFQEKFEIKI